MNEYQRAQQWAARRDLSAKQLAELTGYGERAIYWFWRGEAPPSPNRKGRKIQPWVWQRFKRACEGVEASIQSGKPFNWGH